ncbi:Wzz/FepE/Etk N-terminal domain-containing protein [Teredinibacter haidensis]|uniref:Wzz/FepE/Etk N-terminal domain-containing protein n=1 Tax=Teredinibacter haidensis TaxID=2731755 RepID=UPI000B06D506|nr:Wzz/FepE/Etk N-terminal domain-containing protein [Teredinibacter haidensis]
MQNDIEKRMDNMEAMLNSSSTDFMESRLSRFDEDEIDLRALWDVLWKGKWIVIATTFVFALASVFYALSLPNVYKAQALLSPSDESKGGGLSALAGSFGGLASLAGVDLGASGDKSVVAIEIMKSRRFINEFIHKHNLLVPLVAAKGWNLNKDSLIFDSDIYDQNSGEWIRDVSPPRKAKPSDWEAYEYFLENFSVSQDKKNGLIVVSIKHFSPTLAQEWVSSLILDINEYMRTRDVEESSRSIEYLSLQLGNTSVADMRKVFSQLIEEQTKTIMLANVRQEYTFTTIDPAVVPEEKDSPKRSLIVLIALILGGFIGVVIVFIRHALVNLKESDVPKL